MSNLSSIHTLWSPLAYQGASSTTVTTIHVLIINMSVITCTIGCVISTIQGLFFLWILLLKKITSQFWTDSVLSNTKPLSRLKVRGQDWSSKAIALYYIRLAKLLYSKVCLLMKSLTYSFAFSLFGLEYTRRGWNVMVRHNGGCFILNVCNLYDCFGRTEKSWGDDPSID